MWQTETWRTDRLERFGRSPRRRTCLDQMGPNGIACVRTAADPTFRVIAPPSTTGEGLKIPRNLTKLGHSTGHSRPSQRYLG
jgi:hypothetical protein